MSNALKRVEELLKFPDGLCRQCGLCCTCVSFKGGLNKGEIREMIENPETAEDQRAGAKDFLSIFEQYADNATAKKAYPEVYRAIVENSKRPEVEVALFKCRFYNKDSGGCTNYETRPSLCRAYPVISEKNSYFPGCGYEETGKQRWAEIEKILEELKKSS
ncbi:hypothetical protein tpqmel_0163 [Candidatus Gastranaerophilus sp. (ex Termes propinquus)]|nr:hypothetical protein tpqmel_0163 [Candidatus Gastranaerophilus sp. (ex Termes propinquus)]